MCIINKDQEYAIITVDPIQKTAIDHTDGPMLVVAGPGSGKTTVLTHRILRLIRQEKILPGNLLVITYTNAAAFEMKNRFLALSDEPVTDVTFGTFHAVFYKILRYAFRPHTGGIISDQMQIKLIQELCRGQGIILPHQDPFYQQILSAVSRFKNELATAEEAAPAGCSTEQFLAILKEYQDWLSEQGLIDFDDMQICCRNLFRKRPDLLRIWQDKFRYILVDEFQDCSPIQYELVKLLAAPQNNLFLVGDDDQSIYSFRGSDPMLMQQFLKDYPDARKVTLAQNYRSYPQIIQTSYQLIERNQFRLPKKRASAAGTFPDERNACAFHQFADQRSEIVFLRTRIRALCASGYPLKEIAVLTRTNSQLPFFREALTADGIPCVCKEMPPFFYHHWVAEDVLSYLRLAAGDRSYATIIRIMNRPTRYLSRKMVPAEPVSFAEWSAHYADRDWIRERIRKLEDDLALMGTMRPFAAVTYLLKAVGYEDWMKNYAKERHLQVDALTDVLTELSERAKEYDSIPSFLESVRQAEQTYESVKHTKTDADGVRLMTFHAAKGLEYPVVFLPDLCEGIVPWHRAVFQKEIEEERRMLYVAMTRAKEKLFLLTVGETGTRTKEPSRFLYEMNALP